MNEILISLCEHFKEGVLNPDSSLASKFNQDEINLAKLWLSKKGYVMATPHYSSKGDRPDGSPDQVIITELTDTGRKFVELNFPDKDA